MLLVSGMGFRRMLLGLQPPAFQPQRAHLFCLFWGAVAVLWVRLVYPGLCRLISAIPRRVGKKLAAVMAVFLAVSTVLSAAALYRMDQRREGVPAGSAFSQYLDEHFPDSRLQARYPNMGILD